MIAVIFSPSRMTMTASDKNYDSLFRLFGSVLCCLNQCMVLCLLLLLSVSLAHAEPSQGRPAWHKKIGVECGFGIPYGLSSENLEVYGIGSDTGGKVSWLVSPNWRVGVVGWYGFLNSDYSAAVGPEIGFSMSSKQRVEFGVSDGLGRKLQEIIVEEYHVQIPMYLQGSFVSSVTGGRRWEVKSGYELSIAYASRRKLSDFRNHFLYFWDQQPDANDQDFQESGFTRVTSNLVVGSSVYFLKGCYLTAIFKVPLQPLIDIYRHGKRVKKGHANDSESFDLVLASASRILCASFTEFSVGINIMAMLSRDSL
jgi:hypothetical protein